MSVIALISIFTPLMPVLLGLIRWRCIGLLQRRLLLLIAIIAVNQLLSVALWEHLANTRPLFLLYIMVEGLGYTWLYAQHFKSRVSRHLKFMPALALVVLLIDHLIRKDIWADPHLLRTVEGLLLLFYAGTYFGTTIRQRSTQHPERTPVFWMSTGLLVFFGSIQVLTLFSEFLFSQSQAVQTAVYDVQAIIGILLYVLLTLAMLCPPPTRTS